MKTLKLPTSKAVVEKTGLPFYDAARLIGAAHRRYGTATVEVQDHGSRWMLIGPKIDQERRSKQLAWVLDSLPAYASSVKSLRSSIEKDALGATVDPEPPQSSRRPSKSKNKESGVYYYLESTLQTGIRGPDPLASYRSLASQAGLEFTQSLEDVADAAFGVSFAAVSRGRQEEGERRVLPIFDQGHLVLGPFLDFRRSYQHEAGGFVAAVWASLVLLEELANRDLPVADFAYNWVIPRVQSSSGYVGVDRVCQQLREHKERGEEFQFAQQVRTYLAGTNWGASAVEYDLARALAHFATTADVKHLEAVARLKARLMARDGTGQESFARNRAMRLFANSNSIQEVKEMAMANQQVDVPEGVTRALARWFSGGGKDGWIGQFIKLENASSADRFLDETQRILSRAKMNKENPVDYSPPREEQETLDKIRGLTGPHFRSLKAVFLLDLQAKMTYQGRRSETPPDSP